MGVKTRKYVRNRDQYDPAQYDQHDVDPSEIPPDAPTHCEHCKVALTPLRRLSGKSFCNTNEDCLLAARHAKTANWRLVDLHKQGEELVIVGGGVINTSKRGI